jgi:hypothetical protein
MDVRLPAVKAGTDDGVELVATDGIVVVIMVAC